jgi:UDP-N-acetylmuramoyl-tripeptide--D-alanyl-D-alanine ligase
MNMLWTSQDMIAAMGGRPVGELPVGVFGIGIDSRTIQKDDAFFAIKGDQFDGHDFTSSAIVNGASLIVVSEAKLPALGRLTVPMIVVPDVLKGLEQLALAARKRSQAHIIAVTGSVGKTTTKQALAHVLSAVGRVHASVASFNNHWGVPLTLARLPVDAEFGVFEIGMNHFDEIRPLVKMVQPHTAIITLIAAAHLGHFKNLNDIAKAKAEIFEGVIENGSVILNRDDPHYRKLASMANDVGIKNIYGFGENQRAHFKLMNYKALADCSCIIAEINELEIAVKIGSPGRHIVQNALAVLGAASMAGADMTKVALAFNTLTAEKGRGQQHKLKIKDGFFTLIDESYNANPASMAAALSLAGSFPIERYGRRIAVLGDMLELGKHAQKLHAELSEHVFRSQIHKLFLCGPEMIALKNALSVEIDVDYAQNVEELKEWLVNFVNAGDVVVIKSSNGIGFSKLVEYILKKFPKVIYHYQ